MHAIFILMIYNNCYCKSRHGRECFSKLCPCRKKRIIINCSNTSHPNYIHHTTISDISGGIILIHRYVRPAKSLWLWICTRGSITWTFANYDLHIPGQIAFRFCWLSGRVYCVSAGFMFQSPSGRPNHESMAADPWDNVSAQFLSLNLLTSWICWQLVVFGVCDGYWT